MRSRSTARRFPTILIAALLSPAALQAQTKQDVITALDEGYTHYAAIAHHLWENPELGYQEEDTVELLQNELEQAGFVIERGLAGIPTALTASFGSGRPTIGILAEFDALPGMSQSATPHREAVDAGAPGQACGHHLFGTGSLAAAIAIKSWLADTNTSGTIRYYGTPAEGGRLREGVHGTRGFVR